MTPLEEFDAAVAKVNDARGSVYGHPADDFRRAAEIKRVLAECPDPELRHTLEMIAVKMARLIQTPGHVDSWVDIFGYARCGAMILDRRQREGK